MDLNGGKFRDDVVHISAHEGSTRVHHMYGLHNGPEYARLSLERVDGLGRDYLAICDDAFGNHFLLNLRGANSGAILFLDHEAGGSDSGLTCIAAGFSEFVEAMKSEDESMAAFRRRDPRGYEEFESRLREMKRLRAEELKRGK